MEFDDELEDEGPSAPLLPAPDRLWRHPSEIGRGSGRQRRFWRVREPRMFTVALLAAILGALLATGGTVAAVGLHPRVRTVSVPALERHVEPVTVTVALPKTKQTGSVVGAAGAGPGAGAATPATGGGTHGSGSPSGAAATGQPLDVVAITQRLGPAVVSLIVQRSKPSETVTGSAVMFRSDGYLLTNARLVSGATTITALLDDTRRITGHVVGTDPESGVALLKISGAGYQVAPLGSTEDLQAGQPAIAVGATNTSNGVADVAVGTVRALGRNVDDSAGSQLAVQIETDAQVDAAAVGGALVDANGVVIGITQTSGSSTTSGGSAAPIDLAYAVATQLIDLGHVAHAWLGIDGQDLDPATAAAMELPGGAVIAQVQDASPAAAAGLDVGDVITALNGRIITSMSSLMVGLRTHVPGDEVYLHARRDGEDRTFRVVLSDWPPNGA